MEALGAVSSALAVADAAAVGVRKTVMTLRRLKKAPQELHDLLEQVEGITFVVKAVSEVPAITDAAQGLVELLNQLKRQLLELEQLIHFKLVKPKGELEVDRIAWVRHLSEISNRLGSISKTTNYLAIILSAMTFLQSTRLQRQVEHCSVATGSSPRDQSHAISSLAGKLDGLTLLCEQIQRSLSNVDKISKAMEPLQQMVAQISHRGHHSEEKCSQLIPRSAPSNTSPNSDLLPGRVSVRLNNRRGTPDTLTCPKSCRCQCHKRRTLQLPSSLRYWLGTLNVSVANPRYIQLPCNVPRCRRRADMSVTIQYVFPSWFAAEMISAYYKRTTWGSVDRLIRVVQIVETDAFCFTRKGNLPSLRDLYSKGRASIHDVSPMSGYTALIEAIMSLEFDVIRFLLKNGADTTQGDLYGIDANTTALERYFNPKRQTLVDGLCAFFDINGIMEEQQFTLIHRIILGRSNYNLADALHEFPELIDTPDMFGRTPLFWAVWRGDLESMELLLLNGADIGSSTYEGRTIFHLMAQFPDGPKMFSILTTCYTISAPCAGDLRYHINRQDSGGHSPLHHAIQRSQSRGTSLLSSLLNHGPDLSLKSGTFGRNLFHYISMHANAATISYLFRDLSMVDLLAADIQGDTAMDLLLARLRKQGFWYGVPPYCPEDAVALVKFVSHARTFEPRLPRIVYGPRLRNGSEELDFRLFDSSSDTLGVVYKWPAWVDVEEWVEEHGQFEIPDIIESEVETSEDREGDEGEDVMDDNDKENDTFFDATDLPSTLDTPPAHDIVQTVHGLVTNPHPARSR
jgi:ankyrin repeat protein